MADCDATEKTEAELRFQCRLGLAKQIVSSCSMPPQGVRTQVISRSFMMGTSKSRAPSALEGEIAGGRDDIIAGSLLPYVWTKKQLIRSGTRMTSCLEELLYSSKKEAIVVRRSGFPVPVRPGGSGTSSWTRKVLGTVLVDQQDFAGCISLSATS
jgi:hypothetical protein